MNTAWILNAVGLYCTTLGALLIAIYIAKSPRFAEEWLTPEGKKAYAKHRRLLIVGVGLLAAWLLLQYLGLILP